MTDRYAFRYTESLIQKKEKELIFKDVLAKENPLLSDVRARLLGLPFSKGESCLGKLGIRILGDFPVIQKHTSLVDDYGADAVRLTLIEDLPLTHENMTGYWRFINNLWRQFQESQTDLSGDISIPMCQMCQKQNLKGMLIELKSFLASKPLISEDLMRFCYPFMPHLILSLRPHIHTEMPAFFAQIQKKCLPQCYFVEINGHLIDELYLQDEKELSVQALALPVVQKKIKNKSIQKIIIIPNKGVNFVL